MYQKINDIKNDFLLLLLWLGVKSQMFHLGCEISFTLFIQQCVISSGLCVCVYFFLLCFKKQYPVEGMAAGLTHGKSVVKYFYFLAFPEK